MSALDGLLKKKASLSLEVQSLLGKLNQTKLLIITKKNDDQYIRIEKLKLEIKDLQEKLTHFEGIQSKVDGLKKTEILKQETLSKNQSLIPDLHHELHSIEEALQAKNTERIDAESYHKRLIEDIKLGEDDLNDKIQAGWITRLEELKIQHGHLTEELGNMTAKRSDPLFLLPKSLQKLESLRTELAGLKEYYDPELNANMDIVLPLKEAEKAELLMQLEELKEKKQMFYKRIEDMNVETVQLEESYVMKKEVIKEKQERIREIEEENQNIREENEKLQNMLEKISEENKNEEIEDEEIDKLEKELADMTKEIGTKENNYKTGIRSVNNRINQIKNINNELKSEIRALISRISVLKLKK